MDERRLSQTVRIGFICVIGIILIFVLISMNETDKLKSGEVIIPPELKEVEKGVSLRFQEPLLCIEGKCSVLTQEIFSIIDEMNSIQFYLILVTIGLLSFEVMELVKHRKN